MHAPWVGALLVAYATVTAGLATEGSRWTWWLAGAGVFLWALDLALARRGVIAVGEAFWPDALRSLTASALAAFAFGLPVVITLWGTSGATPAMRALLSVTVGLAVGSQVFAEPLQRILDRLVFRARPALQQARAELRITAETLSKADDRIDLMRLSDIRPYGRLIFWADVAWVSVSAALLGAGQAPLTNAGMWLVILIADMVAIFALLEYLGLRRLRAAE